MLGLRGKGFPGLFLTGLLVLLPFSAYSDPLSPEFYLVGDNGSDRCRTTDCVCRVRPGPRPANPTTIETSERRMSTYFGTAEYELTALQQQGLADFLTRMSSLSGSPTASIMAYTDGCGSGEYNETLARRRLVSAIEIVEDSFSIRSTLIHPEAPPQCPLQEARRVDVIVHTSRELTTAIDRVPADVYLIDGSGSMWPSWRQWTDIVNASYKPGSRIYVSKVSGCRNGQSLNSISPSGGTEIWYAYYSILDTMQPGETLVIVSDFDSDIPLKNWERRAIEDKVHAKRINVIAIRAR